MYRQNKEGEDIDWGRNVTKEREKIRHTREKTHCLSSLSVSVRSECFYCWCSFQTRCISVGAKTWRRGDMRELYNQGWGFLFSYALNSSYPMFLWHHRGVCFLSLPFLIPKLTWNTYQTQKWLVWIVRSLIENNQDYNPFNNQLT